MSEPLPRPVLPPISPWKIIAGGATVLVLITTVVITLWWAATRGLTGSELVTARLDALKVGLSLGVGSGGLFALYLTWRRQRAIEAELDNRERTFLHPCDWVACTRWSGWHRTTPSTSRPWSMFCVLICACLIGLRAFRLLMTKTSIGTTSIASECRNAKSG